MTSAIDAAQPVDGVPVDKSLQRANNLAAKDEITALQDLTVALLSTVGVGSGVTTLPNFTGSTIPNGASVVAAFQAIETFVEAISVGAGANSLGDLTDITTPSVAIRRDFQRPLTPVAVAVDTVFDLVTHGGRVVNADSTTNDVVITLPATSSLSAREDGYLFSVTSVSDLNLVSITGPTDSLRFQNGFFGTDESVTTVFAGLSQESQLHEVLDVFKVGTLYIIRGRGRSVSNDDLSFLAPSSIPSTALQSDSLDGGLFAASVDFGGTKEVGGGRNLQQEIAGNHSFTQANAGKVLVYTGAGTATFTIAVLLSGTNVIVVNKGGGAITFSDPGAIVNQTQLVLASGGAEASVSWLLDDTVNLKGELTT